MGTAYRELFKLYDLIQNGDISSINKYLTDGCIQINEIIPSKGISVLHLAVGIDPIEKSKECTESLLKHGGNPNLSNEDGITPVHIAAIWGRVDNIKLLVGCGGDPSLRDLDGMSAFDYAAREEQWDVYDYLHNVVDLNDDNEDSKCAYTLDLDKILVSADQIVAEYQYLTDDRSTTRKSDMVREWCEQNSLIINKLYPTILGETYLIDEEPWNKNITLDLTRHTENSYKTCQDRDSNSTYRSKKSEEKEISYQSSHPLKNSEEISGIHPLEITTDLSSESLKRISVYNNFSLPGSPKHISHINYHTKTSLRKKDLNSQFSKISLESHNSKKDSNSQNSQFRKISLESQNSKKDTYSQNNQFTKISLESQNSKKDLNSQNSQFSKLPLDQSLISSDRSLEKALAVVQNRTNEWLSSDDTKGCNTRRSSASSGVSSNYSGGSILLANIHEEYKYEDKEEDVVLIEKRLLASPIVLPLDESTEGSPDQTVLSIASSLPTTVRFDDKTLRAELVRLGFTPGPIQDSTRTLYLKKLHALKVNPTQVVSKQGKAYSIELEKSLRTDGWMKNLAPYEELERKARLDFADVNKKWREGKSKTSFTYLLLDPRLTDNLPAKDGQQSRHQMWDTFVNSIFYVGKGKRSRPYAHLYQALTLWKRGFKQSNDKKVQNILDIWNDKVGVVCLHIFQNIIPAEAYTYEAAMIDVIGLSTLKNLKSGTYYGITEYWPHKERRMLGLYLLYKAMQIFINEGERQLRPDDI